MESSFDVKSLLKELYADMPILRPLQSGWLSIAVMMPKNLVYWCAVRLMTHSNSGEWEDERADDISIIDALRRWDECEEDA